MASQNSQNWVVSIDAGNAFTKVTASNTSDLSQEAIRNNLRVIPSQLATVQEGTPIPDNVATVRYVSGDNEKLKGKTFLIGDDAAYSASTSTSIGDIPENQGKVRYVLPFAVACLPIDERIQDHTISCDLYACLPSTNLNAEALREAAQGTHCFLRGKNRILLTVREVKLFPEGTAAFCYANSEVVPGAIANEEETVGILDIGGGTTIYTTMDYFNGKWQEDKSIRTTDNNGVLSLLHSLSANEKTAMRQQGLHVLNKYKLMEAIREGHYCYQRKSKYNFENVFHELARDWGFNMIARIEALVNQIRPGTPPDLYLIAGGGAEIMRPYIEQYLGADSGFLCLPDAQKANLLGMALEGTKRLWEYQEASLNNGDKSIASEVDEFFQSLPVRTNN